jgi:hypothetical protein
MALYPPPPPLGPTVERAQQTLQFVYEKVKQKLSSSQQSSGQSSHQSFWQSSRQFLLQEAYRKYLTRGHSVLSEKDAKEITPTPATTTGQSAPATTRGYNLSERMWYVLFGPYGPTTEDFVHFMSRLIILDASGKEEHFSTWEHICLKTRQFHASLRSQSLSTYGGLGTVENTDIDHEWSTLVGNGAVVEDDSPFIFPFDDKDDMPKQQMSADKDDIPKQQMSADKDDIPKQQMSAVNKVNKINSPVYIGSLDVFGF